MAGLEYLVSSRFANGSGVARCKEAEVPLDAALDPRLDAFNPAEPLLAAVAACMTKSTLRAAQMNGFEVRAVEVRLKGTRQDSPPRMARIEYELLLDTDEADRRLELIHRNVLKFGTVTSTVAGATEFVGRIGRLARDERPQVSGAAPSATASEPMARLVSYGVGAVAPGMFGIGPVQAVRQALERAGWKIVDVERVEIN